jgi:hypothetical protein
MAVLINQLFFLSGQISPLRRLLNLSDQGSHGGSEYQFNAIQTRWMYNDSPEEHFSLDAIRTRWTYNGSPEEEHFSPASPAAPATASKILVRVPQSTHHTLTFWNIGPWLV